VLLRVYRTTEGVRWEARGRLKVTAGRSAAMALHCVFIFRFWSFQSAILHGLREMFHWSTSLVLSIFQFHCAWRDLFSVHVSCKLCSVLVCVFR
jgi:hypothetical protein